jgi:hypothetical protein
MQIQYNITHIEEWCKSHNMPEKTLQLEHLMQAIMLLQLKKVHPTITFGQSLIDACGTGNTHRYRDHLRCLLDA